MITQLSRSPGTSMPSQKLAVPSSSGRSRLLERLQQVAALAVDALAEDQHLVEVGPVFQCCVHVAQLPVRREQHQGAATDPTRDSGDHILDVAIEIVVLGPGQIGRQADERLVKKVERRRQYELLDVGAQSRPASGSNRRSRRPPAWRK